MESFLTVHGQEGSVLARLINIGDGTQKWTEDYLKFVSMKTMQGQNTRVLVKPGNIHFEHLNFQAMLSNANLGVVFEEVDLHSAVGCTFFLTVAGNSLGV